MIKISYCGMNLMERTIILPWNTSANGKLPVKLNYFGIVVAVPAFASLAILGSPITITTSLNQSK
ncbi:MAG: hypothetical protein ABSA75_02265 [Candidatus Bathyarchaeia archaeon]|jgi:hypothetical protein